MKKMVVIIILAIERKKLKKKIAIKFKFTQTSENNFFFVHFFGEVFFFNFLI